MAKQGTRKELIEDLAAAKLRIAVLEADLEITKKRYSENLIGVAEPAPELNNKSLLDAAPDSIVVVNPEGKIVLVNQQACAMFGYTEEEFLDNTLDILIPQRFKSKHEKHQASFFKNPSYRMMALGPELFAIKKDGNEIAVEISLSYYKINNTTFVLCAIRDTTSRKKAELALKASEENYRALVENSESAIAVLNREGQILYVNPAGLDIWMDPHIIGKSVFDIFPEEYAKRYIAAIHSVIDKQMGIIDEVKSIVRGHSMWFRYGMTPLLSSDGTVTSLLINFWDMTEKKRAEIALMESRERYQSLFDNSPNSLWEIDLSIIKDFLLQLQVEGITNLEAYFDDDPHQLQKCFEQIKITDVNRTTLEMFGVSDKKTFFTLVSQHLHSKPPAIFKKAMISLYQNSRYMEYEEEFVFSNNVRKHFLLIVNVTSGYEATLERVIVSLVDITERKRAEKLIYAQRDLSIFIQKVSSREAAWKTCLDIAMRVTNMECGAFYIKNEQVEGLKLVCQEGIGKELALAISEYPFDLPGIQKVLSGSTIRLGHNDLRDLPVYENEGIKSLLITPIVYRDQVIGILNLLSRYENPSVNYINQALDMLSVEIGNALAYERTNSALHQSESHYRTLVNTLDISLCRWLPDSTLIFTNKKYRDVFGFKEEIGSQKWFDRLPDSTREVTSAFYKKLSENPDTVTYEHPVLVEDGVERYFQWIDSPILDTDGKLTAFQSIGIDITERKQMEDALVRNKQILQEAQSIAQLGSWTADIQGGTFDASPEVARLIGWEPGIHKMEELLETIHPDDRNFMLDMWNASMKGSPYDIEHRIILNGEMRWLRVKAKVIFDRNGNPASAIGITQDITKQKQSEISLVASEKRLRSLLNSQTHYLLRTDLLGHLTYWNDKYMKDFGGMYSNQILKNANLLEIVCEYHHGMAIEGMKQCVEEPGKVVRIELDRSEKDGDIRSILWELICLTDENEQPNEIQFMGIEITDRKQVERALRRSEESYRHLAEELEQRVQERTAEVQDLYDNAPTGYHSLDDRGNYLLINQTQLDWLGYTREEIIGQPFVRFLSPSSADSFQSSFQLFKERGWTRDLEFEMIRKDGDKFPVLINATAVMDKHGNFLMSRSTVFDNTERKKADQSLRESAEQNQLLFEESPEAVLLFDNTGRVIRINRAFEHLSGFNREQILLRLMNELELISNEQLVQLAGAMLEALQSADGVSTTELKLKHAGGKQRNVDVSVFALRIQGRQHYLVTMRDITAEKQAEETLRLANTELERALRMKDEFLANMSHELRTPLNAILGISESLAEQVAGTLNEKQAKYINTILESGQHLLELINDILDLAKINAGKIELDKHKVDMHALVQSSLRIIRELAQKKELNVSVEIDNDVNYAWVDERRLKQMLVNLLSNAVKFTPKGGDIGIHLCGDAPNKILKITVWDTGIGIKQEEIPIIFHPFMQLDAGLARESQGTGLGLVLVSQMARLHGGSVSVDSTPGQGSRFTVAIPWDIPPHTGKLVSPEQEKKLPDDSTLEENTAFNILLVEDTKAVVMLLQDYLTLHGYHIITANNGYDGINQLSQIQPDLIFMDVMMPEMDGFETTRRMREKLELDEIPIIGLTALAMPGDRERCIEAGMNDYLSKPIKLQELLQVVKKYQLIKKGKNYEQ